MIPPGRKSCFRHSWASKNTSGRTILQYFIFIYFFIYFLFTEQDIQQRAPTEAVPSLFPSLCVYGRSICCESDRMFINNSYYNVVNIVVSATGALRSFRHRILYSVQRTSSCNSCACLFRFRSEGFRTRLQKSPEAQVRIHEHTRNVTCRKLCDFL